MWIPASWEVTEGLVRGRGHGGRDERGAGEVDWERSLELSDLGK